MTVAVPSGLACKSTTPIWSYTLGQLVNSVAISADGSRIVAATYFHQYQGGGNPLFGVYAFDRASSTPTHIWPLDTTTEGAYWVAISADGTRAASGGEIVDAAGSYGYIQAYDVTSGAVLLDYQLPSAERVNKVALSSNGSVLVACASSGLYVSTATATGYTTPQVFTVNDAASTVALSGDGDWIVLGGYNGTVVLFSNVDGTVSQKASWTTGGAEVRCVTMTSDGRWFAASGGAQATGGGYWLFDTQAFATSGTPKWSQPAAGAVYFVTLANPLPAEPIVAAVSNVPWNTPRGATPSGAGGGVQVVYTSLAGTPATYYSFPTKEAPNSASMSATGRLLGIADGYGGTGNFYLIDLSTRSCVWTYATSKMSWPIAVAANGSGIAAGSDDANVYYFPPTPPSHE